MLRPFLSTLFTATVAFAQPTPPGSTAKLLNAADVRTKLGLTQYATTPTAAVKIAVLDYGFEGCDPAKFPPGSVLIEDYDPTWVKLNNLGPPEYKKGFEPGNPHGRQMAQAAWAVSGGQPNGPVFLMLNANGPTLFRRAVRYAIEHGADIILFSGHFEGGGNYDGKGAINAAVDDAIRAGILWVNAAGNHRGRVFNGPITPGTDGFLRFGPTRSPTLCFTNRLDENTFTITLTWNDYQQHEDAGTTKDLDLFVEDAAGKEVGRSALKQIAGPGEAAEGETKNPRERLVLPNLGRGNYTIRIKAAAGQFTDTDRLRVYLSPARGEPYPHPDTGKQTDPVLFTDASKDEELFPPADHPRVITVGEQSEYSARGPTADRRLKPDVLMPFLPAKWSNGEVAGGTSYSAAYFAGVAAVLRAAKPGLTGDDIMYWLRTLRVKPAKGAVVQPPVWKTPGPTEIVARKRT